MKARYEFSLPFTTISFLCIGLFSALASPADAQISIGVVPNPVSLAEKNPADGNFNYGNVTAAMRKDDPRLLQKVTLHEPQVYVGELLEMLTAKAGVFLSASDVDGAAGEQVAVFVQDRPLGEVMESLWSLLSYQKGERKWQRERAGGAATGAYEYRFVRPASVDALADSLKKGIQKDFEAEADKFLKAARMSPEELKAAAEQDPRLKYVAENERGRTGLQTLLDALSPTQRQNLLLGKDEFTIPAGQLPSSGQLLVRMSRSQEQRLNPGMNVPESGGLHISRDIFSNKVTPSLFIEVNPLGGGAYVGGVPMENKWRANLMGQWLLPGDRATDAAQEATTIATPAPGKTTLYDTKDGRGRTGRRLAQLSGAAPSMPLLARWPIRSINSSEPDVESPYNWPLNKILSRFVDFGQPHKWRGDVLLLGYNNWFHNANADEEANQSAYIPWSLVKRLRDEETGSGGFLTPDTLCWTAANLSKGQRERLAFEEFPVLEQVNAQSKDVRVLLAYLGQERTSYLKEIRTPQGLSVSHLPESVVKMLQQLAVIDGAQAGATVMAVRLEEFAEKRTRATVLEPNAPVRSMRFVFLDRSGTPLGPHTYLEIQYPGRTLKSTEKSN